MTDLATERASDGAATAISRTRPGPGVFTSQVPGAQNGVLRKQVWALQATTEDQQRYKVDELFAAGAILLGRVTYQIWAAFWPEAPKDAGFADRINGIEKYVVSRTLREQTWNNTTVIRSDLAGEVSRLKQPTDGDILVFGGGRDAIGRERLSAHRFGRPAPPR